MFCSFSGACAMNRSLGHLLGLGGAGTRFHLSWHACRRSTSPISSPRLPHSFAKLTNKHELPLSPVACASNRNSASAHRDKENPVKPSNPPTFCGYLVGWPLSVSRFVMVRNHSSISSTKRHDLSLLDERIWFHPFFDAMPQVTR